MNVGAERLAMDGLAVLGTLGFFVPAAIVIALVVAAVVRDRRLSAQEELGTEQLGPEVERLRRPRAD
jgi:hypothetical protein